MATSRDVARRAGVSVATVSRTFNEPSVVRPETVDRVRKAAEELDYTPNQVARALKTETLNAWALVVSDIENPFLTTVARGVEEIAQAEGYSLMLFHSAESSRQERERLRTVARSRCAGVLLTPTSPRTDASDIIARGVPVVAIDRPLADDRADAALVNSHQAAMDAVEQLWSAGARRIACITGPKKVFTAAERADGWRKGLAKVGGEADSNLLAYSNYKRDGGAEATKQVLSTSKPPDAVLFANSLLALGGLEVMQERGLEISRDVHVAAFDDAPWTKMVAPRMLLVRQPAFELGRMAGRMLMSRLEGRTTPSTTVLDAELEVPERFEAHRADQ